MANAAAEPPPDAISCSYILKLRNSAPVNTVDRIDRAVVATLQADGRIANADKLDRDRVGLGLTAFIERQTYLSHGPLPLEHSR